MCHLTRAVWGGDAFTFDVAAHVEVVLVLACSHTVPRLIAKILEAQSRLDDA